MTKTQRHWNALIKAKRWTYPPMIRRYILEANAIKPLTDAQWYELARIHTGWLIDPIREAALRGEK